VLRRLSADPRRTRPIIQAQNRTHQPPSQPISARSTGTTAIAITGGYYRPHYRSYGYYPRHHGYYGGGPYGYYGGGGPSVTFGFGGSRW